MKASGWINYAGKVLMIVALWPGLAHAQTPAKVKVDRVQAKGEDVQSIDGIMKAFYEVVNIAPDAPRPWSRDRTLYSPWIRFVANGKTGTKPEVLTHQQLVDDSEPMVQTGFHEREIFRATRRYGNMVHIDSTYETLVGLGTPKRSRGVNSMERYFDGKRWWIASVMWQTEDAQNPIPNELLPAAERKSAK